HATTRAPNDLVGDVYAILASIFFAAYLITIQRVRSDLDTLTLTTLAIVASTMSLLIACAALRLPLSGFSTRTWLSVLELGLISQLGGYLAITYALGHLPATSTSVGLIGQSALTALLAVPFLGERITIAE